jgi:hypothetical protein
MKFSSKNCSQEDEARLRNKKFGKIERVCEDETRTKDVPVSTERPDAIF